MTLQLVKELIKLSILEDSPFGDITSQAIFHNNRTGKLIIRAEEETIFVGNIIVDPLVETVDPTIKITRLVEDGGTIKTNAIALIAEGNIVSLLTLERPLLNFISKLSGIASLTHEVVTLLEGTGIKLTDTRKTTPGWRILEKYAVKVGGGYNHRFSLSDGVLIKDNHKIAAGGIKKAIRLVREHLPHTLKIEVEVDNIEEYREAIEEKPDIILLDNFLPDQVREAIKEKPDFLQVEVSGGITPQNIKDYLLDGVDFISSGFITYGAKWKKFTAEIEQ